MTTQIESHQVSPPHGEVPPEISYPMSYFDIPMLNSHPVRRLLFYDFAASKSSFLETHIPKLIQSLALVLKHYTPLAGNILYPLLDTEKPIFRYLSGDCVSLTVSESTNDYHNLVGYGARDADQFYNCVPQMPPIKDEPGFKIIPVLAVQITLFPGTGVCIGIANNHSVGDGSAIMSFIKAWASTSRFEGSNEELLVQAGKFSPCFDRKFIRDPLGIDAISWNQIRKRFPTHCSTFPLPTKKVRATYVLNESEIKKLKDLIKSKVPRLEYLSSFVAAGAYAWSNLVKSGDMTGEEADESKVECFIFAVDLRARVDPPVPDNYFGNCVVGAKVKMGHGVLVGDEGFFRAAEAIADYIQNTANNKEQVLKGAENWLSNYQSIARGGYVAVIGSSKFDLYDVDFGWGKARKVEVATIDGESLVMSMCKVRDSERGIEIGLSLPTPRMEAFAALFAHGLAPI
ncbi:malonyl-coenzyme:anthocyanin 5-O-glucoside-6'''-O-malonyltransferase-like [Henckelia pumila]|uniref:malonyl-coenzyme:anthocyanin 5-O-glucoside-6'''-O-malonyltransferase-like n=1 Tax=Henckelia pumila TaxID=405737 RepID=UPI003C6E3FE5